jgi:Flp pilus assembly protein TadG
VVSSYQGHLPMFKTIPFASQPARLRATRNRGAVIVYTAICMVTFCGITSFAVDYGHVQMVKSQLQRMADATARGMCEEYNLYGYTYAMAHGPALYSTANNPVTTNASISSTITGGYWNYSTHTFGTSSGSNTNPAVQVALSTTVPLTWGAVIGFKTVTVHASATAMAIAAINLNDTVQSTADPFLSGMPNGSEASVTNPHNDPDVAPANSPVSSGLSITSGQKVTFAAISGTATNDPTDPSYEPDGEDGENGVVSNIGHNNLSTSESGDYTPGFNNENGIADANIPLNALVGVFLSNTEPDDNTAPANLDFSTVASRNFTTLQPALQQVFFIGDGLTDSGQQQTFIAPSGATRLFLAQWDFYQWSNNVGTRTVQISIPASVQLVK